MPVRSMPGFSKAVWETVFNSRARRSGTLAESNNPRQKSQRRVQGRARACLPDVGEVTTHHPSHHQETTGSHNQAGYFPRPIATPNPAADGPGTHLFMR